MRLWWIFLPCVLARSLVDEVVNISEITHTMVNNQEFKHELFHLVNGSLMMFADHYTEQLKILEARFNDTLDNQQQLGEGIINLARPIDAVRLKTIQLETRLSKVVTRLDELLETHKEIHKILDINQGAHEGIVKILGMLKDRTAMVEKRLDGLSAP